MNQRFLGIYLNDHLAGATAGWELAKRSAKNNADHPSSAPLEELAADIERDRAALEELMAALDVKQDPLKDAAAWLAEKVGRLKLNGQLTGYSPLSRVIELEGLALGVSGKLSLWENLSSVSGHEPKLATADLERLIDRARSQLHRIEELRAAASKEAFA